MTSKKWRPGKVYFGVITIDVTQKKSKSVKKSLENSKNVLEEKRKNYPAANLQKRTRLQ